MNQQHFLDIFSIVYTIVAVLVLYVILQTISGHNEKVSRFFNPTLWREIDVYEYREEKLLLVIRDKMLEHKKDVFDRILPEITALREDIDKMKPKKKAPEKKEIWVEVNKYPLKERIGTICKVDKSDGKQYTLIDKGIYFQVYKSDCTIVPAPRKAAKKGVGKK